MKKAVLGLAVLFTSTLGFAQSGPTKAFDITDAEIKEVLKGAPPKVDQQLMVVDIGKYNIAVGVIYRGKTVAPAPRPAGSPAPQRPANFVKCGPDAPPAGAKLSPPGLISHDAELETYQIISGSGTLVTGGTIFNGSRSAPDSEVTKILNGPSCSGTAYGDWVSRVVHVGDVIIIPPNVAHGWTGIEDHVTYLSVRPDPDHVLPAGYVNPAITAMKK